MTLLRKTCVCLLLLLLTYKQSFSQMPYSTNYTSENGLLSNIIYEGVQDKQGFLWFATELGISRFDGKNFRNYTKSDGLTDNVCVTLCCDSKNRIWIGLLNREYCYIENDKIYNKYNSNVIRDLNKIKSFGHFTMNGKSNLLMRGEKSYIEIDINTLSITFPDFNKETEHYFLGYERYELNRENKLISGESSKRLVPTIDANKTISLRRYADTYKGYLTFISNGVILQMNQERIYKNNYFKEHRIEINGMYRQDSSFLIFTTKGIFKIPIERINEKPQLWMSLSSANNVVIDSDNCLWITTIGNGVFRIPNTKISLLPIKEGCISVSINKNTLLVGTSNGTLVWYKRIQQKFEQEGQIELHSQIRNISVFNNHIFVLTKSCLYEIDLLHKSERIIFESNDSHKSLYVESENSFYIGTRTPMIHIKQRTPEYTIFSKAVNRILGIVKCNDSLLYLGTEAGLILLNNGHLQDTILNDKINMIHKISSNMIACATESQGIYIIENDRIICEYKPTNIKDFICNAIQYDTLNHQIYVGSSEGLYQFKFDQKKLVFLQKLGQDIGLFYNQIQSISYNESTIFLATHSGVFFLEKNINAENFKTYTLFLKSFKANGNQMDLTTSSALQMGTNHIEIESQAVSFTSHKDISYVYYLAGGNTDSLISHEGKITYTNLKPGSYNLFIGVRSAGLLQKNVGIHIPFSIRPYWYQTLYFKLISFVLFAVILYFIFNFIRKSATNKIRNENVLLDMEIKALRSQMNPHFIFNSLNSAQEYIFNNKPNEANKYISTFSKLVRMSLNFSSKNFITIADEIQYLELYLKLEKMKYGNSFSYRINLDESLITDYTYIPSMILQPVVENSLIHGILSNGGNGHIDISFKQEGNYVISSVDDNGIGRVESMKRKNTNKNSIATGNILQRVILLNSKKRGDKISYKIIDKYNSLNMPTGTFFQIDIPINFKHI